MLTQALYHARERDGPYGSGGRPSARWSRRSPSARPADGVGRGSLGVQRDRYRHRRAGRAARWRARAGSRSPVISPVRTSGCCSGAGSASVPGNGEYCVPRGHQSIGQWFSSAGREHRDGELHAGSLRCPRARDWSDAIRGASRRRVRHRPGVDMHEASGWGALRARVLRRRYERPPVPNAGASPCRTS